MVKLARAQEGERRCIVTRQALPRARLIRFVVAPDGRLTPDLAEKLPGRGLWVTADRAVLQQALAKNLFARAAKTSVTIPDDFLQILYRVIERRIPEWIGLANRAGLVTHGFERVREVLRAESAAKPGLLLIAQDAGGDAEKLRALAQYKGWRLVQGLQPDLMGQALDREQAVYLAIATGKLADGIERDIGRLFALQETEQAA